MQIENRIQFGALHVICNCKTNPIHSAELFNVSVRNTNGENPSGRINIKR